MAWLRPARSPKQSDAWKHFVADTDIHLKFRYLPGEYLRALRVHQWMDARPRSDLTLSFLILLVGVATLIWGDARYFWLGIIFLGFSLLLPLLYALSYVWSRVAVAENVRLTQDYWLQFSESGIRWRTENIDSQFGWSFYGRALRTRGFYLLYYGKRQFSVIPVRAVEESAGTQAFEDMLRRHLPRVDLRP